MVVLVQLFSAFVCWWWVEQFLFPNLTVTTIKNNNDNKIFCKAQTCNIEIGGQCAVQKVSLTPSWDTWQQQWL